MKKETLCDAIGMIDDHFLIEAEAFRTKARRPRWMRLIMPLAAVFCLLLLTLLPPADEPRMMLQIDPAAFEGSGAEILLAKDAEELRSESPWHPDMAIDTLPVYRNTAYAGNDMNIAEMKQVLREGAARLGLDGLTIHEEPDSGRVYIHGEGMELEVDADLTLTIFFEPAISLPDDLPFTYTASYEECLHIANILKTHYAKLIGMDDPQTMISGGDRFIDGSQHYQIALYEKGSTDSDTLLNQQFRSASFHCDDEGKLWIIRIHAPDLSQHCGDYPIISVQEAEALLKEGTYLSNVPYDIGGEAQIAKVDLVYRHGQFDRYFMPYYRFLIDIGKDGDMRQYGAFYVPAVASEYIETAG